MSVKSPEDNIQKEKIIQENMEQKNNIQNIDITEFSKNSNEKVEIKKSSNKIWIICGIIFLSIFLILGITFVIFTIIGTTNKNIISGITIKEIDVSNMSKDLAKEKIQNYILENLPENILLKHNDFETSIPVSSLEISFDVDKAVNEAVSFGKNGNFFENGFNILNTLIFGKNIDIDVTLNEDQLKNILLDISSKLPDTVKESSYYVEGNNLIVTRGKKGNIVNTNQMIIYIKNGITNFTLKNRTLDISTSIKGPEQINVEKIYEEVHKEPVNAYYTTNPFTVYPDEKGMDFAISLDEAKKLFEEEKEEYLIPIKILYPTITTNMIGTEAFPDLLSTFSTNYNVRDKNRTTNLILAANKINGTVLMPGETFSYNKVVGERTIAAGYREAPIYVSGEVVDGLGGGICQITSTLYNAVIYANLEVTQRSNHQFVPSYVRASRDATVVYGSIDFKFKNNRNYPIKLICSVSGGVANFKIYGLRQDDDYQVEISDYVTGRTSNAIYSEAYKILKRNGKIVNKVLLSKDVYKSH